MRRLIGLWILLGLVSCSDPGSGGSPAPANVEDLSADSTGDPALDTQDEPDRVARDDSAPGDSADEVDAIDLTPPDPMELGPYTASYRTMTWRYAPAGWDGTREIELAIWYPTLATEGEQARYLRVVRRPEVLAEAEPAPGGPLPVMVFSHGNRGFAEQSYFLTEFFATHGWLVVAPNHSGNTFFDPDTLPADTFLLRPQDVTAALDVIYSLPDDDPLNGRASDQVYAAGHSFGAYTSLVVGGSELPVDAFQIACQETYLGTYLSGLESGACPALTSDNIALMRSGLRDDRVDAVLALAPGGLRYLGQAGPARIDVPVMMMTGNLDESTTDRAEGDPIWAALDGPHDRRVRVAGAGHFTFSNMCDALPGVLDGDGCGEEFIDIGDAHQLVNAFGLAFGRAILSDDPETNLADVDRQIISARASLESPHPPSCPDNAIELDDLDAYGGWRDLSFASTGYFRVAREDDRFWLVTPNGNAFFSSGVNGVRPGGTPIGESGERPYYDSIIETHGTVDAWVASTRDRLAAWGFNSLGAWSEWETVTEVPYTVILSMSGSNWLEGDVPDYWSSEWESHVETQAATLEGHAEDPFLIGVFLDNEVRWGSDHRVQRTLFDDYVAMDGEQPGKLRLVDLLRDRYGDDIDVFNAVWDTELEGFDALLTVDRLIVGPPGQYAQRKADASAFLLDLATRFFSFTSQAISEVAPNHLNLGVRFVSQLTPSEVIAAAGPWVDVLSVNFYEVLPLVFDSALALSGGVDPRPWLAIYHDLSRRPVLIGEFGFRARDSGLPNSWPPIYPTLDTQEDRADGLEHYALNAYGRDYLVGYHWFIHSDQPAEGRFDGEDNNFGLVDISDVPYDAVTDRAADLHRRMYPCKSRD